MNNSNRTTHQKDVSLKTFWRDNEHFADLFNATVFNGKQVLKPDKLTEMDTDVSAAMALSSIFLVLRFKTRPIMPCL